jgi:hypothetical protein
MFAAMKEGWQDVEEHIEDTVALLNGDGRSASTGRFPLKCLLLAYGQGVEDKSEKFVGAAGEVLHKATLVGLGPRGRRIPRAPRLHRAGPPPRVGQGGAELQRIHPRSSTTVHNPKPDPASRARMRAYHYKAQLFGVFVPRHDAAINATHNVVGKSVPGGFPLDALKAYFASARALPTALTPASTCRQPHPADSAQPGLRGAVGHLALRRALQGNEPQVDPHLPAITAPLAVAANERGGERHRQLRFLGATDNARKRAELPGQLLRPPEGGAGRCRAAPHGGGVRGRPDGASRSTCPTFNAFREARREAIWRVAKRVVDLEDAPGPVSGLFARVRC